MVLVLLALAVFATWAAVSASSAGAKVSKANKQQDLYQQARFDVSQEESLERKYRLEPSPDVYQAHTTAADSLVGALNQLVLLTGGTQRRQIQHILALHDSYLGAAHQLFVAVDAGDAALVLSIDHTQAD